MAGPLSSTFVEAVPPAARLQLGELYDLESRLVALIAEGAAAWPQLSLAPAQLLRFVAYHVDAAASVEDLRDLLSGLRPADLQLACACAHNLPGAIEVFDQQYMREVDIALAKMRIGPPQLSDVQQLVRQRLFVGTPATDTKPASPGKIVEYAGRGDLRRWVRAVAVRTCLNELRRGKREVLASDDNLIAQHAISGDDPEVEYMKRTYSEQFRAAFAEALPALGAREQTLLRYHHVDGLNIDEIGAIYRVHRVTAFRWLDKAREQLVATTLELLRARLKLGGSELQSVLRMIRSQINLSLIRQLGGPSDHIDPVEDAHEIDVSDLEEL